MALASNRSLAEQNLDMKPRLEKDRERLVTKYNELEEVRERYKQHCALRGKVRVYWGGGSVIPCFLLLCRIP